MTSMRAALCIRAKLWSSIVNSSQNARPSDGSILVGSPYIDVHAYGMRVTNIVYLCVCVCVCQHAWLRVCKHVQLGLEFCVPFSYLKCLLPVIRTFIGCNSVCSTISTVANTHTHTHHHHQFSVVQTNWKPLSQFIYSV